MKQAFWIAFFILTYSLARAQNNSRNYDTTRSYGTKIVNDTCRVFIRSFKNNGSLIVNIWLRRNNQKIWETTIDKSSFRIPVYSFVNRRTDTTSLSEDLINLGFMTSKELKTINFDNLVLEGLKFDFIRSHRLHYKVIFKDKKTNLQYLVLPGIIYADEQKIKKWKKDSIVVFGMLKMK